MDDYSTPASPASTGLQPSLRLGPPPAARQESSASAGGRARSAPLLVCLLLANLALAGYLALTPALRPAGSSPAGVALPSAAGAPFPSIGGGGQDLALQLEERSLWRPAADEWLALAQKTAEASARAHAYYRAGEMYEKARAFEQAAAAYVAAEGLLAAPAQAELKSRIGLRLIDCLRNLGRTGELGRELARRTQLDPGTKPAAAKPLAYVGGDPLLDSDLDRLIEAHADRMLAMGGAQLDPQAREQLLKQWQSPEQRQRILEELLRQEVLVRRARELGLDRGEEHREAALQLERSLLADAVLRREIVDRLKPTPVDLKGYYESHKERFQGPSQAQLLLLELPSADQAKELAAQLQGKDQAAFEAAVARHSLHEASKAKGGALEEPYRKGASLPGLPPSRELDAFAFAPELQRLSPPLTIGGRHFLFHLKDRVLDPLPPYEEAQDKVRYAYIQEKQKELGEALVQELQARYQVRLVGTDSTEGGGQAPQAQGAGKTGTGAQGGSKGGTKP